MILFNLLHLPRKKTILFMDMSVNLFGHSAFSCWTSATSCGRRDGLMVSVLDCV